MDVRLVVGLLVLAPLLATPSAAQQPFEQCGDIQLVFRNPDLQRQNDGLVHAGGSLFGQFQAIGPGADQITFFGFSFGPVSSPIEDESGICDLPPQAWTTGAYIINYRADTNPDDGFFINLQTDLVPDGPYAVAVHAYDASNTELARGWTNAIVDNCDADGPVPPARCEGDTAQIARNERTAPWPIVLPGDGDIAAAPDRPDGATLTVEFPEELSEFRFFINGKDETANMTAWDGRQWDDDLLPGYGPLGLGGLVVPECTQQPPQTCGFLGESYYYSARAITDDDVVRVEAVDMAGNAVKKEIHIGSGAAGAITDDLPNLQVTVDKLSATINAGEPALFQFTLNNVGGTTAHPFAEAQQPAGVDDWELTFTPAHQPTEPGATEVQELGIRPPIGTPTGTYVVNATISYDKGSEERVQTWELRINVAGDAPATATDGPDPAGEAKESPGLGLVALVAVLAFALRRR